MGTTGDPATLSQAFRDAMASVCTPVTVVTAISGDQPHGATVSAFASLSMTPPMVLVALDASSGLLRSIWSHKAFGVNILGSEHQSEALAFARKGPDKFDGVEWELDHGCPRLSSVDGWLACELAGLFTGGDHLIVLGHVLSATSNPGAPLTYHRRDFGTHQSLGTERP